MTHITKKNMFFVPSARIGCLPVSDKKLISGDTNIDPAMFFVLQKKVQSGFISSPSLDFRLFLI